jgi:hypothetical protein
MTDPYEKAVRELAQLRLTIDELPDGPIRVKLENDFKDKWKELEALVGPSLRGRYRKKLEDLKPRPPHRLPQTVWQRLRAMFLGHQ